MECHAMTHHVPAMPARLRGNADIFERRGVRHDVGDLVGPRDTLLGNLVGRQSCNVFAAKIDLAGGGAKYSSQTVEECTFPGAVRSDDRADFAASHLEIDLV